MNVPRHVLMGAAVLATLVALPGCSDEPFAVEQLPHRASTAPNGTISLEISLNPFLGDRYTAALRLDGLNEPVGAVEGILTWDPARIRLVGQGQPPGTLVLINRRFLPRGRAHLIAVAPRGLETPRMTHLVFQTLPEADGPGTVEFQPESVLLLAGSEVPVQPGPMRQTAGLPRVRTNGVLSTEDWRKRLRQEMPGSGPQGTGPSRVPGAADLFGDATQDGIVNGSDVLFAARVVVEILSCFVGSTGGPGIGRDCVAANVRPVNPPGLGETSDDCAPGIETCGTLDRKVNGADVLAIAREAVAIDEPVVGEPIPAGLASRDTVFLSGEVTGVRTLSEDSVYVLSGEVTVGTDLQAGELVVEAGGRIEGDGPGSALIISRNGRIRAEGTPFQPIVLACRNGTTEGCWEGLIVNGNAPVNSGDPSNPVGVRDPVGGCLEEGGSSPGVYGNCQPADSSGVLRWVRILHAGAQGVPALHLRGVGETTLLEQLYVVESGGEGIRVSGGTVRIRKIRVIGPREAGLAWDGGWSGLLQFAVIQADAGTVRMVDGANLASDPDALPRSAPHLRNVTLVGAPDPGHAPLSSGSVLLRDGTAGILRSFLFYQQPTPGAYALDIDGAETFQQLASASLLVDSSAFGGYANLGDLDADPPDVLPNVYPPDVEGSYLRLPERGNRVISGFDSVDELLLGPWEGVPDLRPARGAALAETTCPQADPGMGFLEPVSFCGATGVPSFLGEIPWFEPAPPVVFQQVPLDPQPALLHIAVVDTVSGVSLKGVYLSGSAAGVTGPDGLYHGYAPVPDSVALYSLSGLPPGCEALGSLETVLNIGARNERTVAFGAECR